MKWQLSELGTYSSGYGYFNRTSKQVAISLNLAKMSQKSLVLGELSFASMPSSCNCMKMNGIQFWNCFPKLVHCSQSHPCGVVTQHGMTQNLRFLKMSNFNIYVVHLAFGAILGDSKFGSCHSMLGHHTTWVSLATLDQLWLSIA